MRGRIVAAGVAIGIGMLAIGVAGPAAAVPPGEIGAFPAWAVSGSAGSYAATGTFSTPGLPPVTVQSDAVLLQAFSGSSAYLDTSTGFGALFGSTRAQPYLSLRPKDGGLAPTPPSLTSPTPSTTTIDLGATRPAGWGFALGDVDADWVTVTPLDDAGDPLSLSTLGTPGTGNYCTATPKPSSCATSTDVPNWTATGATATYPTGSVAFPAGTAYGNFVDTTGAYLWFLPDSTVRSLRLTYGAVNGSPTFQFWLAEPAAATTISGTVHLDSSDPIPAGTTAELEAADRTPILDLQGRPITAPVDPSGAYTLPLTEQRAEYLIVVDPPAGYPAPAPVSVVATSATVVVPTITLAAAAPPGTAPAPELAATGIDARTTALIGGLVVAGGAFIVGIARRRRR